MPLPDHLRGPEWRGWEDLLQPAEIKFVEHLGELLLQLREAGRAFGGYRSG